jgi:hypothetical protein
MLKLLLGNADANSEGGGARAIITRQMCWLRCTVNAGTVSKSPSSSIGVYAYCSSPQSLQLCSRPVTDADAAALGAVSVRVSIVVAKRALEENKSCIRGVKEYEGRRADGGRREKESDHGDPWNMRLSAVLCGRNMWAADGVSCRVIGSSNNLRDERHFHAGADRRRLGNQQKRNDAENKEQAHMSTPGRAGRMSLSLSPIVHSVSVELGPTQAA